MNKFYFFSKSSSSFVMSGNPGFQNDEPKTWSSMLFCRGSSVTSLALLAGLAGGEIWISGAVDVGLFTTGKW